jgi:hypothetical protein
MNHLGGQMRRRGDENKSWNCWYSDEYNKGKEKIMKAINKRNKGKRQENRYNIEEAKIYVRN